MKNIRKALLEEHLRGEMKLRRSNVEENDAERTGSLERQQAEDDAGIVTAEGQQSETIASATETECGAGGYMENGRSSGSLGTSLGIPSSKDVGLKPHYSYFPANRAHIRRAANWR